MKYSVNGEGKLRRQDMLTQIEIDGFKTFKHFKVELAPFQVIVGPNGSGKSNLFDALQLLSRLAEIDLYSAFQGLRGSADELFTKYADFDDHDQADKPLRQVVITTHSPALISLPEMMDSLIFALKVTHIEPGKSPSHITRMVPVLTSDTASENEEDTATEAYTINQVRKYLDSDYLNKANSRLAGKRAIHHER